MSIARKIRFQYDMRVRPLLDPDLRRMELLAKEPYPFAAEDARTHLRLALDWMRNAHLAVGREGLPNKFSLGPRFGIGVPYPETTGYTINTFLAALGKADHLGLSASRLRELVEGCCTFLYGQQLPNGAFTGGHRNLRNYGKPSIFNTGQIVLGLADLLEHVRADTAYWKWSEAQLTQLRTSVSAAGNFLADQVATDGSYDPTHSYQNKVRTYYARATYGMMRAGQVTSDDRLLQQAKRHFDHVLSQQRADGWIAGWGFDEDLAVLHTIAYTLRGLVEAGHGLNDERYFHAVRRSLDLLTSFDRARFTYPELIPSHFRSDMTFLNELCITGMSQLSIVIMKLPEPYRGNEHGAWAQRMVAATKRFQFRGFREPLMNGVLPASYPLRGTYQPGDLIEWGTKFFMDTLLIELGVAPMSIKG